MDDDALIDIYYTADLIDGARELLIKEIELRELDTEYDKYIFHQEQINIAKNESINKVFSPIYTYIVFFGLLFFIGLIFETFSSDLGRFIWYGLGVALTLAVVIMFGFGLKNKLKKSADDVGSIVHNQLSNVALEKDNALDSVENKCFISGYLYSFVWETFNRLGCKDDSIMRENINYICEGVYPTVLWDIFQKGEALGDTFNTANNNDMKKAQNAYEQGKDAGLFDSMEAHDNRVVPKNLFNYLLNKPINTYG